MQLPEWSYDRIIARVIFAQGAAMIRFEWLFEPAVVAAATINVMAVTWLIYSF